MVEHRAHNARGYPITRVDVEDYSLERGRTEGRARGLQLHEEEGASTDIPEHFELGPARPDPGPRQARPRTLLGGRGQRS
jgi:hypothetical protein